jgi:hypothetical protein
MALATIGVDLVRDLLALLFERHQKQTPILSLESALFWTSTQLLTVFIHIAESHLHPGPDPRCRDSDLCDHRDRHSRRGTRGVLDQAWQ